MVFQKLKSLLVGGEEEREEEPEEVKKLSVEELRNELKERRMRTIEQAEEEIRPIFEKISNIREKIEKLSENLEDAESAEEVHPNIYKSSLEARRLYLKKVDRASERIEAPSEPEWEGLLDFNRSLQDAVNLLKNADVSHGRQVAALFENQVDRVRRLTDSLQPLSRELNTALRKIKLDLDELDEFLEDTSELEDLLRRERDIKEKLEELEERRQEIEEEHEKTKESFESLKRSQRYQELEKIKQDRKELSERKERIRKEIESTISAIARPLRKMDKMIERDEHMVSKEVLDALDSYLDDPVKAALSEDEDLPKLSPMLRELKVLLEEKMKLAEREREKRLEVVQEMIRKRRVKKLRDEYLSIENKLEELKQERKSSSLLEKKEELEGSLEDQKSTMNKLEEKMKKLQEQRTQIIGRIESMKATIRKHGESVLGAEIKV